MTSWLSRDPPASRDYKKNHPHTSCRSVAHAGRKRMKSSRCRCQHYTCTRRAHAHNSMAGWLFRCPFVYVQSCFFFSGTLARGCIHTFTHDSLPLGFGVPSISRFFLAVFFLIFCLYLCVRFLLHFRCFCICRCVLW